MATVLTRRAASRSPSDPRGKDRKARHTLPPTRLLVRRATVFAASGSLLAYLAWDGGGYDIVVRQGVALSVWSLIAAGFAFGVLPRGRLDRSVLLLALAAAGLTAWMTLSLTWTESSERTTAEIARLAGYAGLMMLALTALNRHTYRAAAGGITVALLGIAAIAVISRLFPDAISDANDLARVFRTDRLTYPLDYWNAVGAWGAMAVAAGLAWSAHARLVITRSLALGLVPVAGTSIYLTYSRGGALGAAAAVLAVLALSRNRFTALAHAAIAGGATGIVILVIRDHPEIAEATGGAGGGQVLLSLLLAGLFCVGTVLMTRALGFDKLRVPPDAPRWAVPAFVGTLAVVAAIVGAGPASRAWDEFQSEQSVVSGSDPAARLTSAGGNRHDVWSSALDAYRSEPLTGIGPGSFEFWWTRNGDNPEVLRDTHSLYLEQLAELGVPGLLLLFALLGAALGAVIRARASTRAGDVGANVAMSAIFCVFLVIAGVDWMWEETAVAGGALGAIAVAVAGGSRRLERRERRSALGRPGVRGAIVALALISAALQVPGLVATERLRASQEEARAGDLSRSLELAEQAMDAQPWAASAYGQAALVEEATGNLTGARRRIREAIDKEPTNWRWPLVLARVEAEAGNPRAARAAFRAGRRLAPLSQSYVPSSPVGRVVLGPARR